MLIHRDFKEFLESLNVAQVEYVVIGAYALAFYGKPRYTSDMDILVGISGTNVDRIQQALQAFGFGGLYTAADFLNPDFYVQPGVEPIRIDISTGIDGVRFEEVWDSRVAGKLDEVPVHFISKELYKKNKLASGRDCG